MQPLAIRLHATRKRTVAETEAEVQHALSAAEQEAARTGSVELVDFEAANGNTLSLLVGGTEIGLSWSFAGDATPRFLSQGDASERGNIAWTRASGTRIERPRWSLISRLDALAALDEFAASNEMPESVAWAEPAPHAR